MEYFTSLLEVAQAPQVSLTQGKLLVFSPKPVNLLDVPILVNTNNYPSKYWNQYLGIILDPFIFFFEITHHKVQAVYFQSHLPISSTIALVSVIILSHLDIKLFPNWPPCGPSWSFVPISNPFTTPHWKWAFKIAILSASSPAKSLLMASCCT